MRSTGAFVWKARAQSAKYKFPDGGHEIVLHKIRCDFRELSNLKFKSKIDVKRIGRVGD
jgi:hypothetical protein